MSDSVILTPSMMAAFLVKFFFKQDQTHLIPAGIPEVSRDSVQEVDRRHMDWALDHGMEERAVIGRHRPGRVDTGDQINLTNVRIILDPALHLVSCHRHFQAGKPSKQGQREKKSIWVVTLCYTRLEPEKPAPILPLSVIDGLRSLQERAWQVCDVWSNPNGLGTLNFKGLNDDLPESAITTYILGSDPKK